MWAERTETARGQRQRGQSGQRQHASLAVDGVEREGGNCFGSRQTNIASLSQVLPALESRVSGIKITSHTRGFCSSTVRRTDGCHLPAQHSSGFPFLSSAPG